MISIVWRCTKVQPLLDAFELNPELLNLVNSLSVTALNGAHLEEEVIEAEHEIGNFFDAKIGPTRNEDEMEEYRMRLEVFERLCKDRAWIPELYLFKLILRLTHLLHLSLSNLYYLEDDPPFASSVSWDDFDAVVAGLETLSLWKVPGRLCQGTFSRARNLRSLCIDHIPPLSPPLRQLRSLQRVRMTLETREGENLALVDAGTFVACFSETLGSLDVTVCDIVDHPHFFPLNVVFPHLSDLRIELEAEDPNTTVTKRFLTSFLTRTPHLQHLKLSLSQELLGMAESSNFLSFTSPQP